MKLLSVKEKQNKLLADKWRCMTNKAKLEERRLATEAAVDKREDELAAQKTKAELAAEKRMRLKKKKVWSRKQETLLILKVVSNLTVDWENCKTQPLSSFVDSKGSLVEHLLRFERYAGVAKRDK